MPSPGRIALIAAVISAAAAATAGTPSEGSTAGGLTAARPAAVSPEQVRFVWPVPGLAHVVRPFDLPAEPWLAGHRGVDLAAPAGSAVLAPEAGTVAFNGWIVDRHVLVIRHGELSSTLEPVLSSLTLGQLVTRGQAVGLVADGEAWHCDGCLHWGVRRGQQYIDPTLLAEPRPRAVLKR